MLRLQILLIWKASALHLPIVDFDFLGLRDSDSSHICTAALALAILCLNSGFTSVGFQPHVTWIPGFPKNCQGTFLQTAKLSGQGEQALPFSPVPTMKWSRLSLRTTPLLDQKCLESHAPWRGSCIVLYRSAQHVCLHELKSRGIKLEAEGKGDES